MEIAVDGELNSVGMPNRLNIQAGQLPNDLVERRPQVVNRVTHKNSEAQWGRLTDSDAIDIGRLIRFKLADNCMEIALGEADHFVIEGGEVFLRPLQLGSGAIEGVHGFSHRAAQGKSPSKVGRRTFSM